MRLAYSVFFYFLLPFILLRLLWRSLKAPSYAQRWSERFGFPPFTLHGPVLWVHAVSVGETLAAVPLIRALRQQHSATSILITTTTPTGSQQVCSIFADEIGSGKIAHSYAPYDLPDCVSRFLRRVKPTLLIIMETEVWPNTIAACAQRNIPVLLANGRLSEKSARGYQKIAALIKPTFAQLSAVAAQHHDDAERMIALGVLRERCSVTGNIKFDLEINSATRVAAQALRQQLSPDDDALIWIAASTHKGEDEQILEAFLTIKQTSSKVLLILVPRHPERFDSVTELCLTRGLKVQRRSSAQTTWKRSTDVIVGDTMGELLMLYGVADIAFVGGSLVNVGGHNLMEPAAWSLPIISGPYLFNFAEASRLLLEADAMAVVETSEELSNLVIELATNDKQRKRIGESALAVAENNRGAIEKLLKVINSQVVNSGA